MFELKPKPGYAVIEPMPLKKFNPSPLAVVEDDKEQITTGKVIAIGKEASFEGFGGYDYPTTCEIGENVVFQLYNNQPIKVNNQEYYLVRFDRILASLEE